MPPTARREFIRYVGLLLAATVTQGCYAGGPVLSLRDVRWAALRSCWLDLLHAPGRPEAGNPVALPQRHQEALEALVEGGELDPAVAEDIAMAFDQVTDHQQRSLSLCYIAFPPEQMPRQDLLQQVALLEEMADTSAIDPATVAKARAALEQDIEWLAQFQPGKLPDRMGNLEVEATSLEAARILVELLLGGA